MGYIVDANGFLTYTHRKVVEIACPVTLPASVSVGAGGIGTTELADLAVTTGKLAALAVTTAKIAALAVTAAELAAGAVTTAKILAGNVTLPKMAFTGMKILQADGVDSQGGDAQVTLTGTVIGDRVIGIIGSVKVAHAGAWKIPTLVTHFEAVITVTDKIIQKVAAGDLSANTYFFFIIPAAA